MTVERKEETADEWFGESNVGNVDPPSIQRPADHSKPITLDQSQHLAVQLVADARFAVVTGGAGTGKTTCLRFALDELDRKQQSYRLASPTGKAAKRMAECTGRPACTIHRLLEWRGKPQRNRDNPLDASAVVIDEASMLDVELFAQLLAAIDPYRTRLILIGGCEPTAIGWPGVRAG